MSERSAAESDFIDEMTRTMLVKWADQLVREGTITPEPAGVYGEHALSKGWLGAKVPRRLTAKGWSTAASFLRR